MKAAETINACIIPYVLRDSLTNSVSCLGLIPCTSDCMGCGSHIGTGYMLGRCSDFRSDDLRRCSDIISNDFWRCNDTSAGYEFGCCSGIGLSRLMCGGTCGRAAGHCGTGLWCTSCKGCTIMIQLFYT